MSPPVTSIPLSTPAGGGKQPLLGGFLGILLFGGRPGEPVTAGWIGSILGALLLLGLAAGTRRTSRI